MMSTKRFHEIRKRNYSVIVQPAKDMILLHVLENITDVAGNPYLQSNILRLLSGRVGMIKHNRFTWRQL